MCSFLTDKEQKNWIFGKGGVFALWNLKYLPKIWPINKLPKRHKWIRIGRISPSPMLDLFLKMTSPPFSKMSALFSKQNQTALPFFYKTNKFFFYKIWIYDFDAIRAALLEKVHSVTVCGWKDPNAMIDERNQF